MALNDEWKQIIKDELSTKETKNLFDFLRKERETKIVYPEEKDVFNALNAVLPKDVKVVILGQDPYHNGAAHGFAFSVKTGKIPKSLQNIYKEIESDTKKKSTTNGNLESWANQGVLLLNTCLSVRKGEPASHKNKGWEEIVKKILSFISTNFKNNVFILWGNNAKSFIKDIDAEGNLILSSAHPSPLSCKNFYGCKHFSKCNAYLKNNNKKEIDW
ncbi:MAG: uracil-DNA glycosylase [Clostridia bacterium]